MFVEALPSAVAVVALLVLWFVWKYHRILLAAYRLPAMPGYPAYPIIGHTHYLRHGYIGMANFIVRGAKDMARIAKCRTVVWWLGMPLFMLFDTGDIQTVLSSSATREKGSEIHAMDYAVGNGIITAPWRYWKVLRRHLNPLFHPRNLNQLMPVINKCGRDLALNLSRHVGTGHVDVQHYVCDAAAASTCYLLFGSDFQVNVGSKPFIRMNAALERISSSLPARTLKPWLRPDFIFNWLYRKIIYDMEMSFIEYFKEPLAEFQSRRELQSMEILNDKNSSTFLNTGMHGEDKQLTIVDVYLKLQQINPCLTHTDLRKEIVGFVLTVVDSNIVGRVFIIAGSDTTKVTVSSCLLALSVHPEIQDKLHAEVASVMSDADEDVSMEHLKNMPYLDQVFNETLRWFVVAPMITRIAEQDVKLSSVTVPAGSTVGVCMAAVHYDPRHYPNPERFDPDNFLPERVAARPKCAFVAFSGGPRGCIGKHYSMMTVKTFLVHVLRKYRLSSDVNIDSMKYVPGLAFSFLEGYRIQFQHR